MNNEKLADSNQTEGYREKAVINIFHNPLTAWIILAISLLLTIAAYHIANGLAIEQARDRFEFRALEIEKAIEERLLVNEQFLWSTVGMMYTHDDIVVTRDKFAKFVETNKVSVHWPGIQGIGFSVPVNVEEKEAHIEGIRSEGFPEFTIKPEGDRDMYSSIIYLEPFDWRNQRAFGYDMWSNPMRREAMANTWHKGEAVTSGVITLVQETDEDVQRGFLTYVPVYQSRDIPETIQERNEQFVGWVYAAFRVGNLMQGIIGSEDPHIKFEVYDSSEINSESLLYKSYEEEPDDDELHDPAFNKITRVTNQGRVWTLHFFTPKNKLAEGKSNQPRFIAIGGVTIDLLLFYVIMAIYSLQKRANSIAQNMTKGLRAKSEEVAEERNKLEENVKQRTKELELARNDLEERVEDRTKKLQTHMRELEIMNEAMVGRELKMEELKKENEQLRKKQGGS